MPDYGIAGLARCARRALQGAYRLSPRLAVVALLMGLMQPSVSGAQARGPQIKTTIDSVRADGSVKAVPIGRTNVFDLFANVDLAAGYLRTSGTLSGGMINEGGPVSANQGAGLIQQQVANNNFFVFFEMGFVAAAPPGDFKKIVAAYPGASAMIGSPGYTEHHWLVIAGPTSKRILAADNQLGKVFSGISSAADGSCRSDLRAVGTFQLLPMKDCPSTWGSDGFAGKLLIPDSLWRERFNTDKTNFRWDDWRIARSRIDARNFMGTQSVYGYMSDYARELKLRYGSVVKGGTGTPVEEGFPLGLDIRVDSWTYAGTQTQNTQYYQAQIVNRSAEVYGTGVDYDSLYFGLGPGFLNNGFVPYVDLKSNTVYFTMGNTSGRCSVVFPKGYAGTTFGPNCNNTSAFRSGVYTMTWLKSPLGDMRNKLFSDPASAYYNPQSPFADDTITFNHFKNNSFGQTSQNISRSKRSAFGMISSTELNYLDGRSPSDFTVQNYVTLFQPETWNGVIPSLQDAHFNKFVPGAQTDPRTGQAYGKWDYNNDGIQDTISIPMCGRNGCAGLYSDSSAGGFRPSVGNILNTMSAGPFKLKANDTTQFLFAFAWAPDSLEARRNVEREIAQYMNNFDAVTPFAFPAVSASQTYVVQPAAVALAGSTKDPPVNGARITLRLPRIDASDPYALRQIARIRADSTAGDATTLRLLRMNAGLLAKLEARAKDNLNDIAIYKSCDDGTTFTTTTGVVSGCTPSPLTAVTSASIIPWLPLADVRYTLGVPASATVVDEVPAGHQYLYSFVTRSRGFADFKIVDSSTTGFFVNDVTLAFGLPSDSVRSSLLSNPTSIAKIYAPISQAAGTALARVDTTTVNGAATQSLRIGANGAQVNGSSRIYFANQFIVRKTVDTVSRATNTTIDARWVLPLAATSSVASQAQTNFVAITRRFTAPLDIPVSQRGLLLAGTQRSIEGTSRVFIDTISLVLATPGYVWVTNDNRPIYVTTDRYTARQELDQQSSPLFPGFTFATLDSASSTGFARELTRAGVLRDRNFLLRSLTDTASAAERDAVAHVLPIVGGGVKTTRGGTYNIAWITDPFGPGAPFTLGSAAATKTAVDASLAQVIARSTTITDTSAFAVQQAGFGTARKLVRARLPFTMTYNRGAIGVAETVRFAMVSRVNKSLLLGAGKDTVRVPIADSVWIPGDTLVALHHVEGDSTLSLNGTGTGTRFTVVAAETVAGISGYGPIKTIPDSVGIRRFTFGCAADTVTATLRPNADRFTCNPVKTGTLGASSIPFAAVGDGWRQIFELTRTFDNRSVVDLIAKPTTVVAENVARAATGIVAVPNPYIWQSSFDVANAGSHSARMYFTGVPDAGTLRVYSISGQFLQQLTWTRGDLVATGSNSPSGDLPYNLKTREGLDLSSGLYLFVVTGSGSTSNQVLYRGKFVIIR